jgi:hypothetical protein
VKKYLVRFYYFTDLRFEIEVEAEHEFDALKFAYSQSKLHYLWCSDKGFRIEITLE